MSLPLPAHYRWLLDDESVQVTLISHEPGSTTSRTIIRVDRDLDFRFTALSVRTAVIEYADSVVRIDGRLYDLGDDLMAICGLADALFEGVRIPEPGETVEAYNC